MGRMMEKYGQMLEFNGFQWDFWWSHVGKLVEVGQNKNMDFHGYSPYISQDNRCPYQVFVS